MQDISLTPRDSPWQGAGHGTRNISPALSRPPRTDSAPAPRRPIPALPRASHPAWRTTPSPQHSCKGRGRELKCRAQLEPKLPWLTSSTNSSSTGSGGATAITSGRQPLLHAQRKADFTSLPCSPAKTNTISSQFIGPGGLIPRRSLSTKYYYYPNCWSRVFSSLKKVLRNQRV